MFGTSRVGHVVGWLVAAGLLVAGGCGKKITITQFPSFYTPDLKTVLVVPFQNATTNRSAGAAISDKFANAMMANGTYEVFSQNDLKMLADVSDLKAAAGDSADALANVLRKRGRVQAIVTGTVTAYGVSQQTTVKQDPIYGARGRIVGYNPVQERTWQGTVEATARMVRVADGSTIHATDKAVGQASATGAAGGGAGGLGAAISGLTGKGKGSAAPTDPASTLAVAADRAVQRLVEEFAVVRKVVSVKKDAFIVASEYYDGKWQQPKSIPLSARQAFVVVNLPVECDRNSFVVRIVRKDQREVLFEQPLTWERRRSGTLRGQSFAFSPADIAAKGGGPGEYVAKLYSGDAPVMDEVFKLAPPQ